ncbi:hypothetical protein GHT09_007205 [Marmota monax]|uniref:Uncharacterized protein n=1 Tax=Marmota monax TaxID=9995 RepID=A0A834QRG3_MARMO|nr:hypothetical protein GHT09_007205 [Marmota monax]
MIDDSTLQFHDVVPGGVISLSIWHYDGWIELVLAAAEGDLSKLSCLGITEDSFYRTANSRYLEGEKWKRWTSQRAFVALYIASHRGHYDAVRYLLEQELGPCQASMGVWECLRSCQAEAVEARPWKMLPVAGRQKFKAPGQGAAKGFLACYFQPEHCWGHGHTVCTIPVPPAVGTSQVAWPTGGPRTGPAFFLQVLQLLPLSCRAPGERRLARPRGFDGQASRQTPPLSSSIVPTPPSTVESSPGFLGRMTGLRVGHMNL